MKKILISGSVVLLGVGVLLFWLFNSNYYESKLLVKAIREKNIEKIEVIVEHSPECINTYPTISSVYFQSAMNIKVLYPLNEACKIGSFEIISLLVQSGADVNCNDGFTPLSLIYSQKPENWYKISLYLIEQGASLDYISDSHGGAVLQDIVQSKTSAFSDDPSEVMQAFLFALQHCDHSKIKWAQVLQHSVSNDRIDIVDYLLSNGYCNVNDMSNGFTPLMFAARDSNIEMINLLLNYDADIKKFSIDGKTAYDIAVEHGKTDIAERLK